MSEVPRHGLGRAGKALPRPHAGLLTLLALGVLCCGLLVYVIGRPAGTAMGLPHALEFGAQRGASGAWAPVLAGSLPSFAHAFAFSLLSCVLLPRRRLAMTVACLFWLLLDSAFEILQVPALAKPAAAALHSAALVLPGADRIAAYLLQGRFDTLDLLAGGLGAAAAFACAATALAPRSTDRSRQEAAPQ